MEGSSNGNPATVGEGCDNEATRGAHELKAILHEGVDLSHSTVVKFLVPVVAQLLLPPEVLDVLHLLLRQVLHDVSCVHVRRHKSHDNLTLQRCELAAHEERKLLELFHIDLLPLVERVRIRRHVIYVHFRSGTPHDLRNRRNDLSVMGQHPLLPLRSCVVLETLLHQFMECVSHLLLHSVEPLFHRSTDLLSPEKWYSFSFSRYHGKNVNSVVYIKPSDVVEAGSKILLDHLKIVAIC